MHKVGAAQRKEKKDFLSIRWRRWFLQFNFDQIWFDCLFGCWVFFYFSIHCCYDVIFCFVFLLHIKTVSLVLKRILFQTLNTYFHFSSCMCVFIFRFSVYVNCELLVFGKNNIWLKEYFFAARIHSYGVRLNCVQRCLHNFRIHTAHKSTSTERIFVIFFRFSSFTWNLYEHTFVRDKIISLRAVCALSHTRMLSWNAAY